MITITLNNSGQNISVPQSWAEIRLGDYEQWFCYEASNRLEQINYIAGICHIDPDVLLESPVQVFDLVSRTTNFLFDENTGQPENRIEIEGISYAISSGDELTLAEWVDIESVFEGDSRTRLSEILAILCRPAGEGYDSKRSETRRPLFANLPMDKAMPLLAFFLLQNKRSETISSLYSQIKEQGKLYLHLMLDFAGNGAGTKSLPIWRRIKFFFLTKYLQNRLSKFSDSSSTASIKPVWKQN
ncbi:hypothetical protein [Viscerimonas tarda]